MTKKILLRTTIGLLLVVVSLVSCRPKSTSSTQDKNNAIEIYLDSKVMQPSFGGKVFSAHKVLESDKDKFYVWALLQEYYKKDAKTLAGSGWSVPLILNISESQGKLTIVSHVLPRDGDLYGEDIKKLFPKEIQQQVFDFPGSVEMQKLEELSKKRSEAL
ncbi:MAG: hypothetical protein WCQ95_06210 [Bacteroidota bacterium]